MAPTSLVRAHLPIQNLLAREVLGELAKRSTNYSPVYTCLELVITRTWGHGGYWAVTTVETRLQLEEGIVRLLGI